MTIRVVIHCDGERDGDRCPALFAAAAALSPLEAREAAVWHGWSRAVNRDLCPDCTSPESRR